MKFTINKAYFLLSRYLIALLIAISGFSIIYLVMTPLTLYPVYFLTSLIYPVSQLGSNSFLLGNIPINLIPACISGAAYYLLIVLNLTTPMELNKRLRSLLFLISSLLILNIIRIFIFTLLAINNSSYFDIAHLGTWYFGSTIMLVFLWFINIRIFKINSIPVYTDFKNLYNYVKKR